MYLYLSESNGSLARVLETGELVRHKKKLRGQFSWGSEASLPISLGCIKNSFHDEDNKVLLSEIAQSLSLQVFKA